MKKYELALRDIEFAYRGNCTKDNQKRLYEVLNGVILLATHDDKINFTEFLQKADETRYFLDTWAEM